MTEYEDGFRTRYIGVFRGNSQLLVVVRINQDGTMVYNYMHGSDKRLNQLRVGQLIYTREEGKR
ncbi:hypothetical protein [Solimonas aquatica]|uniref:hypothetical protein n=1 Tax=Solimonas aquatica TaxID=489703 RepID=UPI0011608BDF|nr:hypothetical protein [Solimonas aquatica]